MPHLNRETAARTVWSLDQDYFDALHAESTTVVETYFVDSEPELRDWLIESVEASARLTHDSEVVVDGQVLDFEAGVVHSVRSRLEQYRQLQERIHG